jgi:hypothetical protein
MLHSCAGAGQTANPQVFSGFTAQPHERGWAMKKHAGFMPL